MMSDDGGLELQLELRLGIGGGCKPVTASSSECSSTSSSSPARVNHVVGWPPVRRPCKIRSNIGNGANLPSIPQFDSVFGTSTITSIFQSNDDKHGAATDKEPRPRIVSPYVKVNMDGYPIGRKVDLTSFESYEMLAQKLEDMFFNSQQQSTTLFMDSDREKHMITETRQPAASKLLMGSSEFLLTFEDKDGDWMLVGDVPWRMFCNSVKRLRIMRTSGANMGNIK